MTCVMIRMSAEGADNAERLGFPRRLSLPSFPEDPLARVDLPMHVAAPSSSGKRRWMMVDGRVASMA